jgi:hypothetical protein
MRAWRLAPPAALWLLTAGGVVGAQEAAPSDVRGDIDRLAYQIDESVRQVCRPSPLNLFGPTQLVRGYRIPEVGVVFVVPPRALPPAPAARGNDAASQPAQAPPAPRMTERRAPPPPPGVRRSLRGAPMSDAEQADLALRAFEEQVRTMDEAASRMHQEVQLAMAQMMRAVQQPNGSEGPQPAADARQPAFPPVRLLPPWSGSWGDEAPADTRSAREVIKDVRAAVARALTNASGAGLAADESLVVAVEFFTDDDTLDLTSRPSATLVARVKAGDLQAHRRSSVSDDELLKRIAISEF